MLYFDGRFIPIQSKSSVMLIVIARIYVYRYLLTEFDFCIRFDYRIRYAKNLVMELWYFMKKQLKCRNSCSSLYNI